MIKGKIIFYDDDPVFTSQFQQLMEESGFEIIVFNDLDKLRSALSDGKIMSTIKCLVFDLAKDKEEARLTGNNFAILEDINAKFDALRIPIFIHSTYAKEIPHFQNCGTVWKITKSGTSVATVVDTITKLDESGFIEAFTPGGIIEKSLMEELHKSFTEQFRETEIEKIIETVKGQGADYRQRSIQIFKRIAVRALLSEVLSPILSEKGGAVNTIEHYYRRINKLDFWTGDIIKSKNDGSAFFILTPRCNIFKDEELLICPVSIGEFPDKIETKDGKKEIAYALTNNPEISGYNRFLPPSPIFEGGKILLSKYLMKNRKELAQDYNVIVTLSDELTNEILGKFGSYFFRTGITPWDQTEVIKQIANSKDGAK